MTKFFTAAIVAALTSTSPLLALAQTRILDGDTLEVDGTVYRLNGIDAPEHGQKCGKWSCGKEATDTLVNLAEGRAVECDAITKDGYGRTIATCHANGIDLGAEMVSQGMAWAFVRFTDVYVSQESEARSARRGIWSGNYQTPWEFRDEQWKNGDPLAPEGCPIKGNISENGRIYHAPWSPWYRRTKINTAKGERWFCSEAEAKEAGWRQPYWH
ncbi:thermonuclease family protein [Aliiroseovarius sp. Z3]|uniref:thermonuclease family protein n=1 Tax=Aliiroseovarius sp. Z3 TaxID=2811402 RepID=UPI0023B35262|nr:thermonuclease family protein [Aliiroseovarius sp. Z3]MDE9452215.1 thermonuclease family protein [Aliiroseovarius sp. Z3]